MEQVTANVYANTRIRGCNPSYVVTSDGVVVIDTPQLPTRAVAMRAEAEAHGPIRYLINTEHHVDHIFGNYWFKGAGTVVNHQGAVRQLHGRGAHPRSVRLCAEAIPTDDPDGAAIFPDRDEYYSDPNKGRIVFTGDLVLRVGETTFRCLHTPGHTPGQLAVHVPEEGVVFTGDTIFNQCQTWLMTSDIDGWLAALERIRTLDFEHLVPGTVRSPIAPLSTTSAPSCSSGAPASPPPWPRGSRARRRRPASTSRTASRSTSVRST